MPLFGERERARKREGHIHFLDGIVSSWKFHDHKKVTNGISSVYKFNVERERERKKHTNLSIIHWIPCHAYTFTHGALCTATIGGWIRSSNGVVKILIFRFFYLIYTVARDTELNYRAIENSIFFGVCMCMCVQRSSLGSR